MREQSVCGRVARKQFCLPQTEQPGGLFTGARRYRRKSLSLRQVGRKSNRFAFHFFVCKKSSNHARLFMVFKASMH